MKIFRGIHRVIAVKLSLLLMIGALLSGGIASANPLADNTSARSITIWKYAIDNSGGYGNPGTGNEPGPLAGRELLGGIRFQIQKVNVQENVEYRNPAGMNLTFDAGFGTRTGTTGAKETANHGRVVFDLGTGRVADGLYLVTELPDEKIAKPAEPFFVWVPQTNRGNRESLIYNVQAHPKNILKTELDPEKTVGGMDTSVDGSDSFSIKAGQEFTWRLQTDIPPGLYYILDQAMELDGVKYPVGSEIYADYFRIIDQLSPQLILTQVSTMEYFDGTDWVPFASRHYSVTPSTVPAAGITGAEVVFELEKTGMKWLIENEIKQIRGVITTKTPADFNGEIENTLEVEYKTPGLEPIEEEIPPISLYTGGFDMLKVDAKGNAITSDKAEFKLAESLADANAGRFLSTDGKFYTEAELPTGVTHIVFTTDATGRVQFNGLALDVKATPISKTYWIVETKAPAGYNLLKEPISRLVTVGKSTLTIEGLKGTGDVIVNHPDTELPFTGGDGRTLLIIIALAVIAIGTGAVVADRKRRRKAVA